MAFESINVSSLKNSLIACRNSLNHNISERLIFDLVNPSIWLCDSKKVLQDSIYKLNNIMFLTYQLRKDLRWTITRKYATP